LSVQYAEGRGEGGDVHKTPPPSDTSARTSVSVNAASPSITTSYVAICVDVFEIGSCTLGVNITSRTRVCDSYGDEDVCVKTELSCMKGV
jgi:hypothetical protein